MSSCDTHTPVSVYPFLCHFPPLICLSMSGLIQPCIICAHLSEPTHLSQSCTGPSCNDADMNAMPMLVYAYGGGGSPVTKLANEACDLFKGMPKRQHQNEMGHTRWHTCYSVYVYWYAQNHICVINYWHYWIYVSESISVLYLVVCNAKILMENINTNCSA